MNDHATTLITLRRGPTARASRPCLALAVLWSHAEPDRVGEVALVDAGGSPLVLGRAPSANPLELIRQRPGGTPRIGSPHSAGISREQWRVTARGDELVIENIGRRALIHRGARTDVARARAGDLVEIEDELLMMVVTRPSAVRTQPLPAALLPPFGLADQFGLVGESPAAWQLRRQLAFAAGREDHVLLTGPSGSGKELAAGAIHGLSRRGRERLTARNAATLPEGLIDAELFGNPRDYPNPGMPERPGLLGAADHSTLFLDEIGELPHALQAHLLRVIDSGEYHRLGESRARRVDVRVVAATNRDPLALKHDLLARLRLRVRLPGLDERREDIPLIACHLLRAMAAGDPAVAERAFPDGDVTAAPAWSAGFVASLVTASYTGHVRELQARLWQAIGEHDGDGLTCARSTGQPAPGTPASAADAVDPATLSAAQVADALEAAGGSRDRAWRALGLRSRHQLVRLMRRHQLGPGGER